MGGRDYDEAYLPETLLCQRVPRPFPPCVKPASARAMSAYLGFERRPATTGTIALASQDVPAIRKFTGVVVSDANSVKSLEKHGFAKGCQAGLRAFNAGVSMEMAIGFTAFSRVFPPPLSAVKSRATNR
jgi:beta-glucosidase-like glycosyl hydrolase